MRLFGYEIRKVKKGARVKGLPEKATCLHPIMKSVVEFAFEIDGKEYWQFKNVIDTPAKRFQRLNEFMREAEMRITGKELVEMNELIKDALNKGKHTDAVVLLNAVNNLTSQFIETDTFYRLFTCVFFDLEEDIMDYDYDYNEPKIESFKAQPQTAFFFSQPMSVFLPGTNLSQQDLQVYLNLTTAHKQHLQNTKDGYIRNT